jgi:SH3-like domain-containing protein
VARPEHVGSADARRPRLGGVRRAVTALAAAAFASAASATEYRSIAQPAVLYDGPSKQARKLFAAPRGMPVEVISSLGPWVKVRDMAGDVVWIERPDLADRRTVLAATIAAVRQQPRDTAPVVLHAERGVMLELVDPAAREASGGWLQVRHRDGGSGWVRVTEVWGW